MLIAEVQRRFDLSSIKIITYGTNPTVPWVGRFTCTDTDRHTHDLGCEGRGGNNGPVAKIPCGGALLLHEPVHLHTRGVLPHRVPFLGIEWTFWGIFQKQNIRILGLFQKQ